MTDSLVEHAGATRAPDRSRFSIFLEGDARSLDETGMMTYAPTPEDVAVASGGLLEAGIMDGAVIKQLFRQSGDDGFSLVYVWFKANYHLPRHSHSSDCLYYVVSGSVILGARTLRAGDGFYIPADHPYGYRAGPEGCEVLEFRHATDFDFVFHEKASAFAQIMEAVAANHDRWADETVPPVQARR